MLVVPQVSATAVYEALGTAGREAITSWVVAGGHLVTWGGGKEDTAVLGHRSTIPLSTIQISLSSDCFEVWSGHSAGAQLASQLGLSMTQFDPPSSSCPG